MREAGAAIETRSSGAHTLLSALAARGVRHLFGVPGHGAYPIYDALCDVTAITPIVGRHEQTSLFSALGYAWASGSVAVATSVPEAGLTNAATGLLEATLSQERLLFVIEESPLHRDLLRAVTRSYRRVDRVEEMAAAVHAALDELTTGRPGAVALEIPNQVLAAPAPAEDDSTPRAPAPPAVPSALVERASEFLSQARRCVILAGGSAAVGQTEASLRRLAEALRAPVLVDGLATGLLPTDHPLALGRSWSPSSPAERLIEEADAVLVIGAPTVGGASSGPWNPRVVAGARAPERLARQLVLVDWDARDHGALPAHLRLYGHVPSIMEALADSVVARGPEAAFPADELDAAWRWPWDYAAEFMPWAVPFFEGLGAALPRDAVVLLDSLVGLWLDRLLPATPRAVRFPFGTGTLGFGVPAAIGAKLARPEREVVVVAGDGAFLYNPQELATMQRYGLKLTVVIANDNAYGAIKHNMNERFGRATAYALTNPDFVRLGEAFGMRARRLADAGEIGPALTEALAGEQSSLIEAPLELRPPRGFYA